VNLGGHELDFVSLLPGNSLEAFECKWDQGKVSNETRESFKKFHALEKLSVITFTSKQGDKAEHPHVPIWNL
jgi:hypothetical protein